MKVPKWLSKLGTTTEDFDENNEVIIKLKTKEITVRCSEKVNSKMYQIQVQGFMPKPFKSREEAEEMLKKIIEANKNA